MLVVSLTPGRRLVFGKYIQEVSVKAQLTSWPLLDSRKWIGSWGSCIVLFNPVAHLSRFYFIYFSSVQIDFIFTWQNTPVTMLCSVSLVQMSHGETKWLRICFNAFWPKFWVYLITHENSLRVSLCKSTLSGWALWESQNKNGLCVWDRNMLPSAASLQ